MRYFRSCNPPSSEMHILYLKVFRSRIKFFEMSAVHCPLPMLLLWLHQFFLNFFFWNNFEMSVVRCLLPVLLLLLLHQFCFRWSFFGNHISLDNLFGSSFWNECIALFQWCCCCDSFFSRTSFFQIIYFSESHFYHVLEMTSVCCPLPVLLLLWLHIFFPDNFRSEPNLFQNHIFGSNFRNEHGALPPSSAPAAVAPASLKVNYSR